VTGGSGRDSRSRAAAAAAAAAEAIAAATTRQRDRRSSGWEPNPRVCVPSCGKARKARKT
jgi:hypothetical protein